MRWASHASLDDDLSRAATPLINEIRQSLAGSDPDLVLAFAVPGVDDALAATLAAAFPRALVVGASAGGVIGGHRELEGRPALGLTAACLPGIQTHTQAFGAELGRHLEGRHLRAALAPHGGKPELIIALLDPKSGDPSPLLKSLDEAFPNTVVVGGLTSGAPNQPALLVDARVSGAGGVLVALHGNLRVHPIVAQGCRPIGEPMLVTRVDGQLIHELGQRRPVDVMRDLHQALDARDRALFERSLFLGIEMRDQLEYRQGDFLIRNVLGIQPESGALAVGAVIDTFKAVQFHLRDAQTSKEDLMKLLTRVPPELASPSGALLFSCVGRGEGLYGEPSHDTRMIRKYLDEPVVGGFFCQGEVGPVGGQTYLHGYTSACALISEA